MMMKQIILPILLIALLPLILKLLIKLRFGFVLLYIILGNTVFFRWSSEHQELANIILFILIGITVLRLCVITYKKIAEHFGFSKEDRQMARYLKDELRIARELGVANEEITITTKNSNPQVKY